MTTMQSMTFKIRNDGFTYACTKAVLYVSDYSEFGEYNHPALYLTFARKDSDSTIGVEIKFQRHRVGPASSFDRPLKDGAAGYMDTRRHWSHSYGGKVDLSYTGSVELIDRPLSIRHEDRLRIAAGRRLARTINKHGLRDERDERDECKRVVAALSRLGVDTEIRYCLDRGGHVDPFYKGNRLRYELGANERAIGNDEEEAA